MSSRAWTLLPVFCFLLLCSTTGFSLSRRFVGAGEESKTIQIRKVDHRRKELGSEVEVIFDITSRVKEHRQTRETLAMEGITPRTIVADLKTGDSAFWIASLLPSSNTGGAEEEEKDDDEQYSSPDIGYVTADWKDRHVTALFVRPDYEGFGIGRLLLQTAEKWLWSQNENGRKPPRGPIWLLSGRDSSLRAFGFYLHMGYTPIGTMNKVAGIKDIGGLNNILMFVKMRPEEAGTVSYEEGSTSTDLFSKPLKQSKTIDDYYATVKLLERERPCNASRALEQYRLQRSRASQPKRNNAGRGL